VLRVPLAAALLLLPSVVRAAPIEFVEQRRNFMVFNDVDGTVENANWYNREPFYAAYDQVEAGFLAVHPDDSEFLIVYSTFPLTAGVGAFYQSLSNDVAGIGYEQAAEVDLTIPAEFFDDTPNSKMTGFLHMNQWTNFLMDDGVTIDDQWISLAFGQELGHAWLAFVYATNLEEPEDIMLGRSAAHWNFYMHTDGSPIEGHRWIDHGDGNFEAVKLDKYQFSDLDLYLMGLMPPEEVQPWFIIKDPYDCVDSSKPDKECAPPDAFSFQADQYRVKGTRLDITIDNVIATEGPRVPAYPDAPSEFNLSFLLIKRPDETLCDEELEVIEEVIDRSIEQWVDQTRGRASLVNRTHTDEPVPPACAPDTTGGPDTSSTGDDTTGAPSTTTGPEPTGGFTITEADDDAGTSSSGTGSAGELDDEGCGCRSTPAAAAPWLLAPLLVRRRRRSAARSTACPPGQAALVQRVTGLSQGTDCSSPLDLRPA
jgi:hypothetical protein